METTEEWKFPEPIVPKGKEEVKINYTYTSDGKVLGVSAVVDGRIIEAEKLKNE